MKANLILTTALAALGVSWQLACSDASTNFGNPDNLSCVSPVPTSAGGAGGGGGGGGGHVVSTADAGGSEEGGDSEGGCTAGDGGCPSWKNDIYPLMTGSWGCASAGCHGGSATPAIDPSSESHAYQELSGYTPTSCTLPFVTSGDINPATTSFVPVLTGSSCGPQMPIGSYSLGPGDVCLVEAWIGCGMHEN